MKLTTEERIKQVKANVKALKGDTSKVTKAAIIENYTADVNWLLKELKKSGLRIVAGNDGRVVGLADHLPKKGKVSA